MLVVDWKVIRCLLSCDFVLGEYYDFNDFVDFV